MNTEAKTKPVKKVRLSNVSVALWKNDSQSNGAFYTVTPSRTYATKEGELRNSDSFNVSEILNVIDCLKRTLEFYQQEIQPIDEQS